MNTTSQALPNLTWIRVPQWTKMSLVGFEKIPGLIRFLDGDEIVYIGMEAVSIARFRRFLTPGGTGKSHGGGRAIYARKDELELEYAILELPKFHLKRVRDRLIAEHRPSCNFERK